MQPRSSLGQGTVRGVQALAMMATCILAGFAAPAADNTASGHPLPHEVGSDVPAIGLVDRCEKMLDLQIAVFDSTKRLYRVIQETPDKKPRSEDQQASLKLAANEKDIVIEATNAIDMLEAEEVSLALLEVSRELRKDMERIQVRLKISDVGTDTQAVEQDIIDTLKGMISALKKR